MRLSVPLVLLGLTVAHTAASACPRGALCITAAVAPTELAAPAPAPRSVRLRVALRAPADPLPALRFAAGPTAEVREDEMPWIWAALRARVYAQLPTQRSASLSMTVAPVVVKGQFDTIPGVGVAGDF